MYKSEVLFLRGVQPWRQVGQVPDLAALVGLAHRLLAANKNRIGHITTGMPQRGAEHWVYGRGGPAVPPLRDHDQPGRPGPGPGGAGHLLVPQLPALTWPARPGRPGLAAAGRDAPGPGGRPGRHQAPPHQGYASRRRNSTAPAMIAITA